MRTLNVLVLRWLLIAAVLQGAARVFAGETNEVKSRPETWAVRIERNGLANFHQVSTNLFRGAQPTAAGMKELKAMGVKMVINLRSLHSDKDELVGVDMKQGRLHMKPWHSEDEDVVGFLKLVTDTNNLPVFVHCQRGADRTGMVCAMYRIAVCGWKKEEAIREMTEGGFNFYSGWKNIVKYIQDVDVEKIKREAGIVSSAEPEAPVPK